MNEIWKNLSILPLQINWNWYFSEGTLQAVQIVSSGVFDRNFKISEDEGSDVFDSDTLLQTRAILNVADKDPGDLYKIIDLHMTDSTGQSEEVPKRFNLNHNAREIFFYT